MKKILAKSEEDFFNLYLKANENDEGELYDEIDYYTEEFKDLSKPKEYPCVIIYYHFMYNFIYMEDFKGFEPIGF
jgi:hypothetical protein